MAAMRACFNDEDVPGKSLVEFVVGDSRAGQSADRGSHNPALHEALQSSKPENSIFGIDTLEVPLISGNGVTQKSSPAIE